MAIERYFSSIAQPTTLVGNIGSGSTSITVNATTGFPATRPYTLAIDYAGSAEELVEVTEVASTTLTVTRAIDGTSAQSHSNGAAIRHVVSARDFTNYQNHQNSSAAVHGVAGTLVGTSDTQTLSNKTLTSPTINSGALAGTFTGTPTFSGAVTLSGGGALSGTFTGAHTLSGAVTLSGGGALSGTFTGTPTFSGAYISTGGPNFNGAAVTDPALSAAVSGDTFDRLRVQADGKHLWGSGAAARDTNLYRDGVAILRSDGTIQATPTSTTLDGYYANLPTSTTGDLLNLRVNAAIQAAMDGTGMFRIYGANAPTTYTPTLTGGGTATFTTQTGWYWRVGKMIFFTAYINTNAAGSGAANVQIAAPTAIDRTTRQVVLCETSNLSAGNNGSGVLVSFTTGTGVNFDRLHNNAAVNITGVDLLANSFITATGWYREA